MTKSVPSSVSLITFNTYLFPVGLRHSLAFPNKAVRAEQIVAQMRRHRCTRRCNPTAAEHDDEHNQATDDSQEEEDDVNSELVQRKSAASAGSASIAPIDSSPTPDSGHSCEPSPSSSSSTSSPSPCSSSVDSLLSADIVLLQEVLGSLWCRQWQDYFRSLAAPPAGCTTAVGEYALVASPRPSLCSGVVVDGGLLLASRFVVLHSAYRRFDANPHVMRFADKGFQHAVLDLTRRVDQTKSEHADDDQSPRVLHVINTHLHPYEASWSVEHGQRVRREQAQQIRAYLLATEDDTSIPAAARFRPGISALVLGGDLNTAQDTVECRAIRAILDCPRVSLVPECEPTMHNAHPFCNHLPEQTICGDYAVANDRIEMTRGDIVRGARHLSDHFPVRVEMKIR